MGRRLYPCVRKTHIRHDGQNHILNQVRRKELSLCGTVIYSVIAKNERKVLNYVNLLELSAERA